ncbi:flagellar motor switch protein FliM [Candidatus Fermentibacteria bacterium]|nr:MAG: flagellar motor switch protein FliM [Candidatus Fermentibacteria bacterium]
MAGALTQEEIDALREAVAGGDIETEEVESQEDPQDQVKVVSYDFRKPMLVSGDQQQNLRIVHESMAKEFESDLLSTLKIAAEVKIVAIDQITYGEFILSLVNPSYLATLSTSPDVGECILEMNVSVLLSILDILLGGDGSAVRDTRELTTLETGVLRRLTKVLLGDLKAGWAGFADVGFEILSEEANPEYIQLVTPETPCMNMTFDVHIGETMGVFNLCYPLSLVQSLLTMSEAGVKPGQEGSAHSLKESGMLKALSDVPLNVHARVGTGRISAQRLGLLKLGDVLCLDRRCDEFLDMYIGDNRAYSVKAGQRRGKVAFLVVDGDENEQKSMDSDHAQNPLK